MKKEEYLSLINEVIAQGPSRIPGILSVSILRRSGMQEINSEFLSTGVFTVFRLSETNGIPEICM